MNREPGRIGPNALLQTAAVLRERDGAAVTEAVFAAAGLAHRLAAPPAGMVPEAEVAALFAAVGAALGPDAARSRMIEAGERTARYLLGHRIPAPARLLLRLLPPAPAARLLLGAITRHGWTFLGSGRMRRAGAAGRQVEIRLADSLLPVAPLAAAYYRATFEALFRALVARASRAQPCAAGPGACAFRLSWREGAR
jgi:divinyl protochlorophyllide a 8-vinyl-reductase